TSAGSPGRPLEYYFGAVGGGLWKTTDGGQTWRPVTDGQIKSSSVGAVAVSESNPDVVYIGMGETQLRGNIMQGDGVYKSADAGVTWNAITVQLAPRDSRGAKLIGKIGVSVSGADSKRVYAIVESEEGGVFASDDAGATWKRVSDDRRLRQRAFYYTRVFADPKARDTVYVLNTGFYKSTDGGKTYSTLRPPHGDNHDLWIAPNDPK